MVYTRYKQKLEKVVNVLNVTWRFKYLIICGVVLILALIFSLCGISGNIYGDPCPDEVEYGTCISEMYNPKAILASAKIEYFVNGEWTEEEPLTAGTYKVRAKSRGAFGTKYSDEYTCIIKKYEKATLTIGVNKYEYGSDPEVSVEGLVDSDTVVEYGYEYEYIEDDTENVLYNVTATVKKIVNENGEDVTSSYYIKPAVKQLTCVKREITILTDSDELTYDGNAHSAASYSITSKTNLVDGQKIEITYPEFVNVGSYLNQPAITIYDGSGNDVTVNYHITYTPGTVEIKQRKIQITTASGEVTYDGEAHNVPEYEELSNKNSLVSGHKIVVTPSQSWTDVGVYINEATITIYDKNNNDVTSNYDYKDYLEYGILTIVQRVIYVFTASGEWVYNGNPHSKAEEGDYAVAKDSPNTLVEGHKLVPTEESIAANTYTEITDTEIDSPDIRNKLEFVIKDANGEDVTKNYFIDSAHSTYSQLRVKSPIIVSLYSHSKCYDGTALTFNGVYTVEQKPWDVEVEDCTFTSISITDVGKVYSDSFEITSITATKYGVEISEDDETNAWYIQESSDPVLEVKPREIEITSVSVEESNTGKTLTNGYWWYSKSTLLVDGHYIVVDVTGKLEPDDEDGTAENTFSVTIYDEEGNDVTENYSITPIFGTLSWV